MPRLSVYVPDELWLQAQRLEGSENTSRLVQRGLEALIHDRRSNLVASPIVDGVRERQASRLREIEADLPAEAERVYEVGYDQGLKLVEEAWGWEYLDWAKEVDFDVDRFADEEEKSAESSGIEPRVKKDVANARVHGHGTLFEFGLRQALRDAWDAVMIGMKPPGEGPTTRHTSELASPAQPTGESKQGDDVEAPVEGADA